MEPPQQRIDLQQAPLMRLQVAMDPDGERWYALLQIHHIICDHETLATVVKEVVDRLEGRSQILPETVPYRNHVAHALAYMRTHDVEGFFREKLQDLKEPSAPFGLLESDKGGSQIQENFEEVESGLAVRVRAQARRLGVSSATLFHAACALLVARTSGQDDVAYGTVLLGRLQGNAGTRITGGMSINTLPLRLRLRGVTVVDLVERTQRELVELLTHEQASLALARRCSAITGAAPLFTVLLNYRHSSSARHDGWSNATGVRELAVRERTHYPIVISVDDLGVGFALTAQTDQRLASSRITDLLVSALRSLVNALEQTPRILATTLSILSELERHKVIELFNATQTPYPRGKPIHELFEEHAELAPDAIAVVYGDSELTYAALNVKANQLARYLRNHRAQQGEFIPILMQRSPLLLIAQLAVLKCGGAFVPIDPKTPVDRQQFILNDCAARLAICEFEPIHLVGPNGMRWIDCAGASDALVELPTDNLQLRFWPFQAAYVMYTSGSTGTPKGVIVPHHAVNRLVRGNRFAAIDSSDCIAHCSNPAFDASTFEIWGALLNGAKMAVMPESVVLGAERFGQELRRNQVTILWLTVGLFSQYAEALGEVFGELRYLITGGDVVTAEAIAKVLNRQGPGHLLNGYGPTECTTFSTTYEIKIDDRCATSVPIGQPISNTRVYILDRHLQPVPIGTSGEIYIGGDGVGSGYLNRPELTAEQFGADPFTGDSTARLYRTGDLGRWRPDGMIEYLGRNDHQVKIRGFRIELGEIEAQLVRHAEIENAAVLAREDQPGDKRLVAYVVAKDPFRKAGALNEALRAHLRRVLPDYMVPGTFIVLDSFPLTSNGKVNRRALPAAQPSPTSESGYRAPEGSMEEVLADIWRDVLRVDRVGRDDNFFELGGHSLLGLNALLKINKVVGCGLTVTDIYRNPTPRMLAARIGGEGSADDFVDLSQEAQIDVDTMAPPSRRQPSVAQRVLLTGATGFVGRFLLAQLLMQTSATVYCLVRAKSHDQAISRIRDGLSTWDLWRHEFEGRVVALAADLSQPGLGLQPSATNDICNNIDVIFHCATSMNHLETYTMAKATNVDGAREILTLATQGRPKTVNYISTLSVFSALQNEVIRVVNEETSIDYERHLASAGYAASKWIGEKIFLKAADRGIPCNIFRLGFVWADTQKGRYDELQREYRIFKSCLLSGFGIRNYRYQLPPTPVDYVARAISHLAAQHPNGNGVFHISGINRKIDGVFERCNEIAGTSLLLLSPTEWVNEIKRLNEQGLVLPAMPLLDVAFPEQAPGGEAHGDVGYRHIRYNCARTHRELEHAGIFAPTFDDDLLRVFVEGMLSTNTELRERYRVKAG